MIQELETATDQHHKEMQEYKSKTNDHIAFLEKEAYYFISSSCLG